MKLNTKWHALIILTEKEFKRWKTKWQKHQNDDQSALDCVFSWKYLFWETFLKAIVYALRISPCIKNILIILKENCVFCIPVIIIAIWFTTNIIIYIRKPSIAIVRTNRLFCLDIIFWCWPAQTPCIINLIIAIIITTVGMSAKRGAITTRWKYDCALKSTKP